MVLGGNNQAERGAVSEEWGEAFTSEREAGLAREPWRTPQGGNTRELERPRDYQASPHQQGKGSGAGVNALRIFTSVRQGAFGPGKWGEKTRE